MPDNRAADFIELAKENVRFQRYDAAIQAARKAIEVEPDNSEAHGILGIAYSRSNRALEAEESLKKALELSPGSAKAYYNLAAHFFSTGDRAEAKRMAELALEHDASHAGAHELLSRIEQEALGVMTPPVHQYQNLYTPPPTHSIGFIRELGWAWGVVGWFLLLASTVTTIRVYQVLWPFLSNQQASSDEMQRAASDSLVTHHAGLLNGSLVFFGLLAFWWILDIADRRPHGGLVALAVVGIIAQALCCFPLGLLAFAFYFPLRSRRQIF